MIRRTMERSFATVARRLSMPAPTRIVDLRSDTVTLPSEEMREAMLGCEVGDDVWGEDPTVNRLEAEGAELLEKEGAVFVPTGTMANLCAIMVHCELRGSEAIVGHKSHIHFFEQGGIATIAGVHSCVLPNMEDGTLDLKSIERSVRVATDPHYPRQAFPEVTRLLCLENTHNKCGGKVLPVEYLDDAKALCEEIGTMKLHLDGARLWNAAVVSGVPPYRIAETADSVSVCLSKGLGAPAGSLLCGTNDFVLKARRFRKALGGGMRQAGVLGACGLLALKNIDRLAIDHRRSVELSGLLSNLPGFTAIPPQSNMVFFTIDYENSNFYDDGDFVEKAATHGLRFCPYGPGTFRAVFHKEHSEEDVAHVHEALKVLGKS